MDIYDAKVNPHKGYENMPSLEVFLRDRTPDRNELRYKTKKVDNSTLYFAEKDGYVSFFLHNPRDQTGYGGSTFEVTLIDGTKVRVKGPWSSRAAVMNNYFQPHCMECVFYQEGQRKYSGVAGAIAMPLAQKVLQQYQPNWFYFRTMDSSGDLSYDLFPKIDEKGENLEVKLQRYRDFQDILDELLQTERYVIGASGFYELLNHYRSEKMITLTDIKKAGVPTLIIYDPNYNAIKNTAFKLVNEVFDKYTQLDEQERRKYLSELTQETSKVRSNTVTIDFKKIQSPIKFISSYNMGKSDRWFNDLYLQVKSKGGTLVIQFERPWDFRTLVPKIEQLAQKHGPKFFVTEFTSRE
jgi:hypothetical protein